MVYNGIIMHKSLYDIICIYSASPTQCVGSVDAKTHLTDK